MQVRCLLTIVFLIISVACGAPHTDRHVDEEAGSGGGVPAYYPGISPQAASSSSGSQEDFWVCGVDYIVTKGPAGETIIVEVRIPCDPLADFYIGCPAPIQEK